MRKPKPQNITGIIGLDLSMTGTGFARISDGQIYTGLFKTNINQGTDIQRILVLADKILSQVDSLDIIFIEDYAFGVKSKVSSLTTLAELGGIVKLLLSFKTGFEPITITTSEMRKFVCGKGNLKKDLIPVEAYKRYKLNDISSHDEWVAIILADIGSQVVLSNPPYPITKEYQSKIVKNILRKYRESRSHTITKDIIYDISYK